MLKFIRGLSPLTEAIIVILGAFGYPIVLGVFAQLAHVKVEISESLVLASGLYESCALIVVSAFLYVRGWDTERFGLKPAGPDALMAVGLGGAIWRLLGFLYESGQLLHLVPADNEQIHLPLSSLSTVVLVVLYSFVDAAFEELFLCGYLLALAKEHRRLLLGVAMSLVIRVAYHLDNGAFGVITAMAFGLVCSGWYARTGRLWPVILGRAFIQLVSFAAIS